MKRWIAFAGVAVVCVLLGATVYVTRQQLDRHAPVTAAQFSPAPPAMDAGPASTLPAPPPGAIVFDLGYRPQTGANDDVQYHSFWGFGAPSPAGDPFLSEVGKRAARVSPVHHSMLAGRQWAAVEHEGKKLIALYFDLNADGRLADIERIPPTRQADDRGVDFITPDFRLKLDGGREVPFRVLLRVTFYGANTEPNFMWSPACVLEGTATLDGKRTRLLLFADGFGGRFDRFGSSSCALSSGDSLPGPGHYLPREPLSSLVSCAGDFFRVKLEGSTGLGHVARALLTRDTSPRGSFAVKWAGTNTLLTKVASVRLRGADDPTVFLNLDGSSRRIPVGTYVLQQGQLAYGKDAPAGWEVGFSQGPKVVLEADQQTEVALSKPRLAIRAVPETERYMRDTKSVTVSPRNTRLYLEPRIAGEGGEVLTRFQRRTGSAPQTTDVTPRVLITSPTGERVLEQSMEYG